MERDRWGGIAERASLALLLAGVAILGFGAGSAEAKLIPGTLTVKTKMVPSEIPPEEQIPGAPTEGKALFGRLSSDAPACERNRPLIGLFEFPPYDTKEPLVRDLYYKDGETRVKTKAGGAWSTDALGILYSYEQETVRVVVVGKKARGLRAGGKPGAARADRAAQGVPSN